MMTKNISRFKKNNKGKYIDLIKKIKEGNIDKDLLETTFPLIDGVNETLKNENKFNNTIEAREYLNNKECFKNVNNVCKYLLKEDIEDLEEKIGSTNYQKLKSSLTLFEYITKKEINTLLTFRNYDTNLIKKVFTENKEFSIFKKLLNKYFDGEVDEQTILIIESEIFEYSKRNKILKNINKNYIKQAEDVLIKYSRISPIILSNYTKKEQKVKIKEFISSLNCEEYLLLCKFNINKDILKKAKIYKNKIKEKIRILSIIGVFLLSIITITTIKLSLSNNVIITKTLASKTAKNEQMKELKDKKEEEAKTDTKVVTENRANIITEEKKAVEIEPTYIRPTGNGNDVVVQIASTQVGNVGGEIYWRWYGFSSRVPWCGVFVSWVANQAGISTDIIPKFAKVSDGLNWYIQRQLFRNRNYTPRSGDLIFFDYDYNGQVDHVGLVEKVENGKVYTIEGNIKNNRCHKLNYNIGSSLIYGYGTPNY